MKLTVKDKVKIVMDRQNMTMTSLAAATGQTRQNLGNKMTRGNFSEADILKIAEALDCQVDIVFTLPNGEQI